MEEQLPHAINTGQGNLTSLGLPGACSSKLQHFPAQELCRHSKLMAENLKAEVGASSGSSACTKQENSFGEVLLSRRSPQRTPAQPLDLALGEATGAVTLGFNLGSVFINISHFRRYKCPFAPAEIRAD